jgi:hypothetical protein
LEITPGRRPQRVPEAKFSQGAPSLLVSEEYRGIAFELIHPAVPIAFEKSTGKKEPFCRHGVSRVRFATSALKCRLSTLARLPRQARKATGAERCGPSESGICFVLQRGASEFCGASLRDRQGENYAC